jgi:hypothetical protein
MTKRQELEVVAIIAEGCAECRPAKAIDEAIRAALPQLDEREISVAWDIATVALAKSRED